MKFFLISDNADTAMGMRLAGIDGVILHTQQEVKAKFDDLLSDESIAVVLVTPVIASMCEELISNIKLNRKLPLVCEIPDRHVNKSVTASIAKYVREAIGINIDEQ
ncbi:MAG: V-type ATP synthase subunit F [Oscillospiraceae bacterium]|nr:V-type ATP synthase subunit F [Oscillospiraceae bacterium]